jgi:hypothetical protein
MSPEHPDKPFPQRPGNRFRGEITAINSEFLRLLTHPHVADMPELLGLNGGIVAALRSLEPTQLETVADAPLLLAEFRPFPGLDGVRDGMRLPVRAGPVSLEWDMDLNDFANRLLTCIWQTARRNPLLTSLSLGMNRNQCRLLAELDFCAISRFAADARDALRVRLSSHPRFWPDLLRHVRTGNESQLIASRMSLVQLSLADSWLPAERTSRNAYLGN